MAGIGMHRTSNLVPWALAYKARCRTNEPLRRLSRDPVAPGPRHSPRSRDFGRPGSRPKTLIPVLTAGDPTRMRDGSDSVTGTTAGQMRVLAGHAGFLVTAASRAPSVHNTQPWRFRVSP